MVTFPAPDTVSSIYSQNAACLGSNAAASDVSRSDQANYDQVTLSSKPIGERRLQLDLTSRISSDVRTFTVSSGEVQQLHDQIAAGTYHPDAADTAAGMLLTGGESLS